MKIGDEVVLIDRWGLERKRVPYPGGYIICENVTTKDWLLCRQYAFYGNLDDGPPYFAYQLPGPDGAYR